jgi:hypothetical protein
MRTPSIGPHVTAPASTLNHLHRPQPLPGAPSRREVPDELGKYQFQVVAAHIADAVLSIGGLIYDRAMAGWEVSVVVDGESRIDDRALRILGARATKRLSDNARALPRPHLLAVATDVTIKSDAMRRRVLELELCTEVLLWGRHHPTNLRRRCVAVRHQPSAAAQVFKSQALIAVGAQAIPRADEGFYSMA